MKLTSALFTLVIWGMLVLVTAAAGPSMTGALSVYLAGSPTPVVSASNTDSYGGQLNVRDESGANIIFLEADVGGTGGYLEVRGGTSSEYFNIDGNCAGTGDPQMSLVGSVNSTVVITSVSGDASVQLPTAAVHADEILNEPGIASAAHSGTATLSTATTDLLCEISHRILSYHCLRTNGEQYRSPPSTSNQGSFTYWR